MKKRTSNIIILSTVLSGIFIILSLDEISNLLDFFISFLVFFGMSYFLVYFGIFFPYQTYQQNKNNSKFPIKKWKWLVFYFEWYTSFYNPIFWLILAVGHMSTNFGDKFWHKNTHKLIYYLGFIKLIIIGTGLILLFFLPFLTYFFV